MAKIKHNSFVDTVDEVISVARDKGVVHLYAQDYMTDGRQLTINGEKKLHFGTCGYLGLEHHPAVKEAAIKAIEQYGTQFPMSKTYISNPLYTDLEGLVEAMYGAPVVISKNCTISHLATIPIIVNENDLVILDHQVHASVQEAVQKMLTKGVKVEMIRHNNLEALEEKILAVKGKYNKVWYMSDGVYSMYGDLAPIKKLTALADKYEELYLYVDDAHGMSWAGAHGAGYVMSQMDGVLHEKVVLTATLGKAFGACGGVTVFPNEEMRRKVKTFGGPNTFSVQLEPPILGAAVASARIHLSEDIYPMQNELQRRIAYCNALLKQTDLPLVAESNSPVFYIGTGVMGMTNDFVHGLLQQGVYVNPALFPAVPAKNNGARFTISLNNQYADIEQLVDTMSIQFEKSLEAVDQTQDKIRKAFRMAPLNKTEALDQKIISQKISFETYKSIDELNEETWNKHLGHRGMFDYQGIKFLEASYTNNSKPEQNWEFRYYIARDPDGSILLMTFAIIGLYKEDTFAQASVSRQLEEMRVNNPYYLTSRAIIMGSMFTEGEHMYLNRESQNWKKGVFHLLEALYQEQETSEVSNIILRDFPAMDIEMQQYMMEQGYVKVDMPETCIIKNFNWNTQDEFIGTLSKRNKKHFREDVRRHEKKFDVRIESQLSEEELRHAIRLFQNVKDNNYAINSFTLPEKLFHQMNEDPNWEFIILSLKPEYSDHQAPIAVCFCHRNIANVYSGMFAGMDYEYSRKFGAYRQVLYQTLLRAKKLGCEQLNLGVSATIEKKKFGAEIHDRVAYLHAKDNFAMEAIARTMLVTKE